MSKVILTNKALALWGGGAVLVAAATVVGVLVAQSSAVPTATSGVSTSAASKGSGKGGGNNGNGVGNGPGGAQPAVKSLLVDEVVGGDVRLSAPATITVSIINPNNQAVILTGVDTELTVTPVNGRSCGAGNFFLDPVSGLSQRLEKSGAANNRDRTTVELKLELRESGLNQDGCKGADLDFTYRATANQA